MRTGVVLGTDATTKTARVLGIGTYEGDFTPHGGVLHPYFGIPWPEGKTNPRIRLDSGKYCWGCEVWWAPEWKYAEMLAKWRQDGWTVLEVDIDDVNPDWRAAHELLPVH